MVKMIILLIGVLVLPIFAEQCIPLKQLYGLVKYYPRVTFCNRNITVDNWVDYESVRHITYTGQIKSGETARALCNCMDNHFTQKDWTKGAKRVCYSRCDKVTYHLSGTSDSTYDPNAEDDANFDQPMEKLRILFENTPKSNPIGLNCDASCFERSDMIYCSKSCQLCNEQRTDDELCAEFEDYSNQNDWLVGASITCKVTNEVLQAEFVGCASAFL